MASALEEYHSVMTFIVLLLVGWLAYRKFLELKKDGLRSPASMRIEAVEQSQGYFNDAQPYQLKSSSDHMGNNEPPVFWNAGSMSQIAQNQSDNYGVNEGNDPMSADEAERIRAWTQANKSQQDGMHNRSEYMSAPVINGQVLNPYGA